MPAIYSKARFGNPARLIRIAPAWRGSKRQSGASAAERSTSVSKVSFVIQPDTQQRAFCRGKDVLCTYDDGMFAAEERDRNSVLDIFFEYQATCYHEAGHAVASHLLGQGCSSVSISVSYISGLEREPTKVAFGGRASESRDANRRVNADLRKGRFTPTLSRYGIAVAAGPAAERRYRIERYLPLRALFSFQGDHDRIDTVAKRLEADGRSRFAYRRLVWRVAQRLIGAGRFGSA